MTLLATLKQMVEALETYGDKHRKTYLLEGAWDEEITKGDAAIQAGKQAIKELESQEPLAWMDADGNVSDNNDHKCFPIPLYTAPPQRTEPIQSLQCFHCQVTIETLNDKVMHLLAQRTEQNFCPRCGKRTPDLITIHTCTPPQEGA